MTQSLLLRISVAAISSFVLFAAIFTLPFAALPMAYIGLAYGLGPAVMVAGLAVVLTSVLLSPPLAIVFTIVFLLPSFAVVRQALLSRAVPAPQGPKFVFYPLQSLILMTLAITAVGTIIGFMALGGQPGLPQSLASALSSSPEISGALAQVYQVSSPEDYLRLANIMLVTSFASWPLLVLGNAQIAQAILVRQGKNLRPATDYATLTLPPWLALGLAGFLALALGLTGWLATLFAALAALAMGAYFLLGLAIIHAISRNWNGRGLLLATLYFLLFVMAWVSIPVSLMGLLDARFDFRGLKKHPDKPSDLPGDKE